MESLKQLYKIGFGPSSSHTMGPSKAAEIAKESCDCDFFEVTIYNSLALTGKGHLTEFGIERTLSPIKYEIKTQLNKEKHPNYLHFKGYKDGKLIYSQGFKSVGGGDIKKEEEETRPKVEVYPHNKFDEIKKYCQTENITLFEYIKKFEGPEIIDYLKEVWMVMKDSIKRGLNTTGILPGPLEVQRKAKMLYSNKLKNESSEITESRLVSAYAFAVSEENAAGGTIVTAPTCGASGVLPAVLYYMSHKHDFIDENRVIEALAVAGLIGNLIKKNATLSGAVGGCQAEIGSATSMAAAAHATLFKLSIEQVEYAAEIAMEHNLGLTCDPVNGYVQIPCIERNAVAALRAINACGLAFFLSDTRKVSFDMVVETMYQTGLDMNEKYRETAEGGLAYFFNKKGC